MPKLKKILTIVGARPQFIKAASVSAALRRKMNEVLVHTGQHYDPGMSDVFFKELGIPEPDHHLNVGSGGQGAQTGKMLTLLEDVLLQERPDYVLIYGDTNSTLAGALAAAKLHIPIGHVESGLRSFNRLMPEEINRITADHVSDQLFCPTETAVRNLRKEGITRGVHQVGDVMYDASLLFRGAARKKNTLLADLGIAPKRYLLLTIHRQSNTDNVKNLKSILKAVQTSKSPVIFPVHPRTKKFIKEHHLEKAGKSSLIMIEPAGYIDFLNLQMNAAKILTDSGGVQKEAFFMGVPCITLRDETEWVETVKAKQNILVGADPAQIMDAIANFTSSPVKSKPYGSGDAAEKIATLIINYLSDKRSV